MKFSSIVFATMLMAGYTAQADEPVRNSIQFPPPTSGGDPHFKTWTGEKFDYHGECDLVLLNNPDFDFGTGMKIHIRTTREGYYSYIETIALQIGDEVLEFSNDVENFHINGELASPSVTTFAGFEVRRFKTALSIRLEPDNADGRGAHIDFLYRKNGFPYVRVDAKGTDYFEGSNGLLGDYGSGKKMGRDGNTEFTDATEFALEWQVRDTEPMLFSTARYPQFPTACIPPSTTLGKRLGDSHMQEVAEEACAAWGEDKDDCIFDVMATRDVNQAEPIRSAEVY